MLDARSDRTYVSSLRRGPFKVLTCLVTLWAFLFNILWTDGLAWAVGSPAELTRVGSSRAGSPGLLLELPKSLGTVKDSFRGQRSEDRGQIVFHIQDAHCNYDAQNKIAEIIGYLNEKYGVETVNLEGGAGDYDFSLFEAAPDAAIKAKATDTLVKSGLITGAESYAINTEL